MDRLTRREFHRSAGNASLAVAVTALAAGRRAQAASANDRVRLAVVGIHGRGGHLAKKFAARAGLRSRLFVRCG